MREGRTTEPAYTIRLIPRRIEPPLDLNWLAEWFGVEVEIRPLPINTSGLYLQTEYESHIILNANDPPERQRWTTAHELAHHILSIGKLTPSEAFRIKTDTSDDEDLCDRFATEILMPAALVRKKASELEYGRSDKTELLADIFDVSIAAMRARLLELGLNNRRHNAIHTR